ncbi:MAG: SUMF1/EgtB/PvdO family nonheme iron enzyme [Sandaracinaceae bacterium]|nr:SUMF1/EgtB/PvdO family nonheme iron enzyme [Myxococcales bacterium]MCB9598057.1 SUMF1/EgtB/PvdO family nonheme iron enzyme [Sandaracinaceae bacterium]
MTVSRTVLCLALVGCASARAQAPTEDGCPPRDRWPEGMACVTGGTFLLGSDDGREDERVPGDVTISSFYMDLHEVTNEAYRACMAAGSCPRHARYVGFMGAQQPVVGVSWPGAAAYCASVGKRLPTDAEFERAARGPDRTIYPWGDDADDPCAHAVVRTRAGEGCGTEVTADVMSRPAGHYGLFDIAGNVHEWVADAYSPCLRGCRRECGDACFGTNPRGPCGGAAECPGHALRSIRGGSWFWPLERARGAARRGAHPENEAGHRFGFRCASDLRP